jgi:predicted membrane channel-forming protein YqfA (hemolysin III family)
LPRVSGDDDRGAEPGESPKEQHDRELIELLNELRVALPGVQVLFAFLLAVPFSQRWKDVTEFQKDVFFVAFIATALSSALMIAPSSYHRLRWRSEDKQQILETSNKLVIAGLFALAVAIEAVVLLVSDYIFARTEAIVTAACVGFFFAVFWYGLALRSWLRNRA